MPLRPLSFRGKADHWAESSSAAMDAKHSTERVMIQKRMITLVVFAIILTFGWSSFDVQAQTSQPSDEQGMQQLKEGCQQDLQSYCSDVTPGRMRRLACIYVHQDKLSENCLQAIYNYVPNIERLLAMTQIGAVCQADIQSHCANVAPGDGGIVDCLRGAESRVSPACRQALQQMPEDDVR